jgi:BirA family transcriptional regulator, biotin operon repressor / biotin---[acetyl-CoA-carboxylase] ligase
MPGRRLTTKSNVSSSPDSKTPRILRNGGLWGADRYLYASAESTNRLLLADARFRHGDVAQARSQTAGRGRLGRTWIDEPGTALLLSVRLESHPLPERIPQAAALAVAALLEKHGMTPAVKWPNDVLLNGRKVAGILAESDGADRLVLGIGLNVNTTADAFERAGLTGRAVSMALASGCRFDIAVLRDALLARLADVLARGSASLQSHIGAEWPLRDFLDGARLVVRGAAAQVSGRYGGLDDAGRLRLVDDAGLVHLFWAGDVTLAEPPLASGAGSG